MDLQFDHNGNLSPALIHQRELAEVKELLVDNPLFENSLTREVLWENLMKYNEQLTSYLETGYRQWICGSFCSAKINPGDIDIVCFVPNFAEETAWRKDQTKSIPYFFAIKGMGKAGAYNKHFIDSYLVLKYGEPITQELLRDYQRERNFWRNWGFLMMTSTTPEA